MPDRVAVGLFLALLGVAGLVGPLAVYDVHPPRYHVSTTDHAEESVPHDASVVAYGELSETERRVMDPPPNPNPKVSGYDPPTATFTRAEWNRADGLRTADYLEYEGGYYPIDVDTYIVGSTPSYGLTGPDWMALERPSPLTLFVSTLGIAFAVVGCLVLVEESLRPLDPTRSALVPVAFAATVPGHVLLGKLTALDTVVGELFGWSVILLVTASLVVVGSLFARLHRRWAGGLLSLLVGAVLYLHVGVGDRGYALALLAVAALLAPFFLLGYVFTLRSDRTGIVDLVRTSRVGRRWPDAPRLS